MSNIVIRPDLRTPGGETNDIVVGGKYAGTLTLVYREKERISGSLQLEREAISGRMKDRVIEHATDYVQSLIDALGVAECDVVVTHSDYDQVIATESNVGVIREMYDEMDDIDERDFEADYVDHEAEFDEGDDIDAYDMTEDAEDEERAIYYELVVVSERRNTTHYHVYDEAERLVAEAYMSTFGPDVMGEVDWKFYPDDDEMAGVTDLIVSDYDEDEIDTFIIDMKFEGEVIETEELTHEALLDDSHIDEADRMDYSVILSRDDGDTLTYEIYRQTSGGLPIATATVDISRRELSGMIDFREPGTEEDRETIATMLMRELDKEKDYENFYLTMVHRNQTIEELQFESQTL